MNAAGGYTTTVQHITKAVESLLVAQGKVDQAPADAGQACAQKQQVAMIEENKGVSSSKTKYIQLTHKNNKTYRYRGQRKPWLSTPDHRAPWCRWAGQHLHDEDNNS